MDYDEDDANGMFSITINEASQEECENEIKKIEFIMRRYTFWKNFLSGMLLCCFFPSLRESFFRSEEGEDGLEKRAYRHLNRLKDIYNGLKEKESDGLL